MGANRKLQIEIDRTLKKVAEGIEVFDEIWEKVRHFLHELSSSDAHHQPQYVYFFSFLLTSGNMSLLLCNRQVMFRADISCSTCKLVSVTYKSSFETLWT